MDSRRYALLIRVVWMSGSSTIQLLAGRARVGRFFWDSACLSPMTADLMRQDSHFTRVSKSLVHVNEKTKTFMVRMQEVR